MGKFLIKLMSCASMIVVLLSIVCVCAYLGTDGMFTKNSYQKGFVYQLRALERSDKCRPKIMVLGGSYMTFAMDMPAFREAMNMPAYSLGVHSGMGQSYTFEVAERFVNPGDIVVFVFAGFSANDFGMPLLYQTFDGEDDLMLDFFKAHPMHVFKTICAECSRRILKVISEYTRNAIARKLTGRSFALTGGYCASAFDPSTGDLVFHRVCEYKKGEKKARVKFDVTAVDPSCFEVINDFCRLCRMRGADMVIAFPPYAEDCLVRPVADLDRYEEELQTKLLPKIIGRQKASIYRIEMMHGEPMHLNSRGARCYTERLIEDIKSYWETSKR